MNKGKKRKIDRELKCKIIIKLNKYRIKIEH